jgi:rubredoxin
MVEVWSWIIGYAVLFAVVQLAIYLYYVQRGEGTPSATGARDADDYQRVGDQLDPEAPIDDATDGVDPSTSFDADEHRQCPHCGTPNQAVSTVRYCRNCTRALG